MLSRRQMIAGALGFATGAARAAPGYPGKPIKVIMPYAPGSPNDVLARLIAPPLAARLGQPVVVEARPGGGTTIGAKAVLSAEPEGHTLLFSNTPTHVIAPLISKGITFDPIGEFVPIVAVGSTFLVLVVAADVPASSVQELVAYAKANPGKLNFGFGQGTFPHLVGELFKLETGTAIANIPYKGGTQAVTDMLGGHVHLNFGTLATLVPQVRAGKLKALAITGPSRAPELPEVPTMIESGLPTMTTVTYYGFIGPAGTPSEVVMRLNSEVNECLKSSELTTAMIKVGFTPKGGSAQEFAALFSEQQQKWGPIVKAVSFQME
ncbi:MAG: Bug family tripartite tricarboxylate transporter substrate binding protein [Xanthobacteraceae bacterium]